MKINVKTCPTAILRFGISIIYWNHVVFNDTGFMPPTWNDGMFHHSNCERSELSSTIVQASKSFCAI
jgi:hypothetical protein